MSEARLIDAHLHFWDPSVLDYPWLGELPELRRAFVPADLASVDAPRPDAFLFVEANVAAREGEREVDWVERLADDDSRLAGIVAYVDLLEEPVRDATLDRLERSARVVGVRHNIQQHAPGFALQPAFVRGVRAVGDRGFPFDLCITAEQLPEVIELVERCPDVRFVLDHCGKPAIRDDAFAAWAEPLARLAQSEFVACKLSGLLTEARPDQRTAAALAPWVEHVRACFGASRMLYGTDWPVSTLGGGPGLWWRIVDELTAGWSEPERRDLFARTAARMYDVEVAVRG